MRSSHLTCSLCSSWPPAARARPPRQRWGRGATGAPTWVTRAATHYSTLDQITTANVAQLQVAWTFDTVGARRSTGDAGSTARRLPDQQPDRRRRALHGLARATGDRAGRRDRHATLAVRSAQRARGCGRQPAAWPGVLGGRRGPSRVHVGRHVALRPRRHDRVSRFARSATTGRFTSGVGSGSAARRRCGSTRRASCTRTC